MTLSAARSYARGLVAIGGEPPGDEVAAPHERARRELTSHLITATCTTEAPTPDGTALYRARSRATQLDISARVVAEGRLLVVVACNVRAYR